MWFYLPEAQQPTRLTALHASLASYLDPKSHNNRYLPYHFLLLLHGHWISYYYFISHSSQFTTHLHRTWSDASNPIKMPPKRKRSNDADEQDKSSKRFAYLKPQVRQVSERTVKSKWTTLPESTQEKIRDMFKSLERPVIVRSHNERRRIEAQAAVQAVIRKYVLF